MNSTRLEPFLIPAGLGVLGYLTKRVLWHAVQNPSCQWFGTSVVRGVASRRYITLTFDDGPSESTDQVLRILQQHRIRATFFQCGQNIHRLPDVTREVFREGHELGNHTYSHPRLCLEAKARIFSELSRTQAEILDTTGEVARYFRPPYGLRWFHLDKVQRTLGLTSVLWSAIGYDWSWDHHDVTDHLQRNLQPGAIFCLHDGRRLQERPDITTTVRALSTFIPRALDEGFEFVSLSDLLIEPKTS